MEGVPFALLALNPAVDSGARGSRVTLTVDIDLFPPSLPWPSAPNILSRAAAYRASRSCIDSPDGGGDVTGVPWEGDELCGRLRIRKVGWKAAAGGGTTETVRDGRRVGIGAATSVFLSSEESELDSFALEVSHTRRPRSSEDLRCLAVQVAQSPVSL